MNRWWILGPLLGATVWLTLFGDASQTAEAVVPPAVRQPTLQPSVQAAVAQPNNDHAQQSALISRETLYAAGSGKANRNDLFEGRNWAPAQAPASAAGPAAPETPAFPYTYVGRKQDGEKIEAYLLRDDVAYLVTQGQTLDDSYRVDSISATQLVVVYLPTHHTHTIQIGEAD